MTKNEHLAETLLLGLGQSELPLQTTASRALHSPGELATARLSSPRGTRCEARGNTRLLPEMLMWRGSGEGVDFHSLTRN